MVPIGEDSYSRGSDMRVFICTHKEQLWQGHFGGRPYKRSPTKRRPVKRIRLYIKSPVAASRSGVQPK